MIQGGDPTGTGTGGQSIWGKPFKDEVNAKLLHTGRGVVSMANSGPHSNGSQFFIMYKSAKYLNYKHSVFGMVVGGLTTLAAMEKVPVDDKDRPLVSAILLVELVYSTGSYCSLHILLLRQSILFFIIIFTTYVVKFMKP